MAEDDEALAIARRVVAAWREDQRQGDRYELLAVHIAGALKTAVWGAVWASERPKNG